MSSGHVPPPLPVVEDDKMVIESEAVAQEDVEMTQDDANANANVSKASEDVEMKQDDADANKSTSRIVHVDTTALNEEQIKVVMADSAEMYPEEYTEIFGLRGSDRPSIRPGDMKSVRRLKCNAGFSLTGQKNASSQFVGASFRPQQKPQLPAPKKTPNPAQKAAQDLLQKQQDAAHSKDVLQKNMKVAFNLDSQTPNIEISTTVDATKGNIMVARIWAGDLRKDDGGKPAMYLDVVDPNDIVARDSEPGNGDTVALRSVAEAGELLAMTFRLREPAQPRVWSGVPLDTLKEIRGRQYPVSQHENTLTRDILVSRLDRGGYITFYLRSNKGQIKEWFHLFKYLEKLFTLACKHGNYWWFVEQYRYLKKADLDFKNDQLVDFPFKVPRWLVKSWQFTETQDKKTTTYSRPEPYTWDFFPAYDELPDADQAAFMLKLGILGEEKRQMRDLKEYVKSTEEIRFVASFTEVSEGLYFVLVKIRTEEENLDSRNIKLPGENTRIQINIDPYSAHAPVEKQMAGYRGTIVTSWAQDECDFACLVSGPSYHFKGRLDFKTDYPVYIGYPEDHVPFKRAIAAVSDIQSIDSNKKPSGVDLKALFLGDDTAPPQPDFTANWVKGSKELSAAAYSFVDSLRPKPNDTQKKAIISTIESMTGLNIIQGPPGTGKSQVINNICVLHSFVLGSNTIVTAPTNEGVMNCVESFQKSLRVEKNVNIADDAWVHFTGAYAKMKKADQFDAQQHKLDAQQQLLAQGVSKEDATRDIESENLMASFRRLAISVGGANTMPAWSFGYKLRVFIEKITQDNSTYHQDFRAQAQKYVEGMRLLPFINDKTQSKALQEDLDTYEHNLGVLYLTKVVKVVFVTMSSAAHHMLASFYQPALLIVDEAAHEAIHNIATAAGPYKASLKQIVLAGDHEQQKPMFIAKDSNMGHAYLSRPLFQSVAGETKERHPVFRLDVSYRMPSNLLEFTAGFYTQYKMKLTAHSSTGQIDVAARNTLDLFWKTRLPASWTPDTRMMNIDVTGEDIQHVLAKNTTTKQNDAEAKVCARTIKEMLDFDPQPFAAGKSVRKLEPSDFGIETSFRGQVALVTAHLKQLGIDPSKLKKIATVKKWQGFEALIMLFMTVVNTGSTRPVKGEAVPVGFVATDKNINVALSRARMARYIIGGLRCFVQMKFDKHAVAMRHGKFFNHLQEQALHFNTLTLGQWQEAMNKTGAAENSLLNQRNLFLAQISRNAIQEGDGTAGVSYQPDDADRPTKVEATNSGAYQASRSDRPKASVHVGGGHGRGGGRGGGHDGGRGGGRGGRGRGRGRGGSRAPGTPY